MTLQSTARRLLVAIAGLELWNSGQRWSRRRDYFYAASERARQTGRRLVVIGDPDSGAHTSLFRAYDCGDLCVDLMGCELCPGSQAINLSTGHVTTIADNSAVVFVSCTLEYIPDVQAAWREILRMAGSTENVYVVPVGETWGIAGVLYPGAQWSVEAAPPTGSALVATPVSAVKKVAVAGGLATLAYLAFRRG